MYVEEIRRQAEAAPRAALPAVAAALWQAFGEGLVSEAEAEALSVLIERRQSSGFGRSAEQGSNLKGTMQLGDAAQDRQNSLRKSVGSRPRTDASMERRRRWAASGRLPPGIAARFTLAEQAVLGLVAAETTRRGDCRLAVGHVAAIVGVAERTVQNAIREARKLGLLTVEERRVTGFRNDTNVVRIVSPEWMAWLKLARRGSSHNVGDIPRAVAKGGGCKVVHRTPTQGSKSGEKRGKGSVERLPKGSGRPFRSSSTENRSGW